MKILTLCLPVTLLLAMQQGSKPVPVSEPEPEPAHSAHQLEDLIEEAERAGGAYLSFLDRKSLSAGLYRLRKGTTDRQQPHELDEVYVVLSGKAQFTAGDGEYSAEAGTVLYVERGVPHAFHEIEEDLVVVVLFSKME